MWIAAHGQILILDNLMLRGHPLANRFCMCCCNEESVDHLLISCSLAHSLWMHMIQLFGIDWVMPGLVVDLLCCWHHWLGKYNSNIWNLVLGCLMLTIWRRDPYQIFFFRTLMDWLAALRNQSFSSFLDFLDSCNFCS